MLIQCITNGVIGTKVFKKISVVKTKKCTQLYSVFLNALHYLLLYEVIFFLKGI